MAFRSRVTFVSILIAILSTAANTNQTCAAQAGISHICISPTFLRDSADRKGHAPRLTRSFSLTILGLVSPAIVSGAITVSVIGAVPGNPLTYCLDGHPLGTSSQASPSPTAKANSETSAEFSLKDVTPGKHFLQVVSDTNDGRVLSSRVMSLLVVPTINQKFSETLTAYALQPSVLRPLELIVERTSTAGSGLTPDELNIRTRVAAMYLNFGIDVSLDNNADQSLVLARLLPETWAKPRASKSSPLSMRFSPDAPFYHPIPKDWPHVKLPRGYIKSIQLNTNQGGDGIGYGIAIAQRDTPLRSITSMWYAQETTRRVSTFRVPDDWQRSLPERAAADRHIVFVDTVDETFISLYKATVNSETGAPHALFASSPTSFDSLGDRGGSTASGFSELPLLIEPGEATSDEGPIRHALGGPVSRTWAARVYPATSRDYGVMNSINSCTGKGVTNTGLIPYGGIIQLDPELDLTRMKLSRPALRILQAMQTYGYYVMDFGCSDLDIYTAIPAIELAPFGGLYASSERQVGVQTEITTVISSSDLYVVPPMTKRPGGE